MDNAPASRHDAPKRRGRRMTEKNGATGGTPPDPAAPATAADIAALRQQIDAATNGLELYRSEENVIERIRKRFANTALIAAAVGFIGIQIVAYAVINLTWGPEIRETVTDGVKAIAKLEAAVAQATKAATKANDAAVAASKKAKAATGRFDKIDERITKAIAKVESEIAGASGSVRAAADKSIADVQKQLANIQDQIKAVSSVAKGVDVAGLQRKQQKLRNEAEKARKLFAANGAISVWFTSVGTEFFDDASMLQLDVTRKGGFAGKLMHQSQRRSADIQPPIGINRTTDRIATIVTGRPTAISKGQVSAIKEILNASGLGYVVRRVQGAGFYGLTPDTGLICCNKFEMLVVLSYWQLQGPGRARQLGVR